MDRQERSFLTLHVQTLSRWLKNGGKVEAPNVAQMDAIVAGIETMKEMEKGWENYEQPVAILSYHVSHPDRAAFPRPGDDQGRENRHRRHGAQAQRRREARAVMNCPKRVQEKCPFGVMCGGGIVADDSGCARFILDETIRQEEADAVEEEYLRQERQAIQEESSTT